MRRRSNSRPNRMHSNSKGVNTSDRHANFPSPRIWTCQAISRESTSKRTLHSGAATWIPRSMHAIRPSYSATLFEQSPSAPCALSAKLPSASHLAAPHPALRPDWEPLEAPSDRKVASTLHGDGARTLPCLLSCLVVDLSELITQGRYKTFTTRCKSESGLGTTLDKRHCPRTAHRAQKIAMLQATSAPSRTR